MRCTAPLPAGTCPAGTALIEFFIFMTFRCITIKTTIEWVLSPEFNDFDDFGTD